MQGERPGGDVLLAAGGDAEAWARLVDRFSGLLWSVARAHRLDEATAADVVQTTWLRLLEHLDTIAEPDRVGAWLATTARRECLAALRQARRVRVADADTLDVPDDRLAPLDAGLLADERDAALWAALAQVAPRCRRLLRVLSATPPPSYAEVGAALEMPVGSIGPTRERCLRRMRALLAEAGLTASGMEPRA